MVAATDAIPQPSERPSVAENDGGDFALGGPRFGGMGHPVMFLSIHLLSRILGFSGFSQNFGTHF